MTLLRSRSSAFPVVSSPFISFLSSPSPHHFLLYRWSHPDFFPYPLQKRRVGDLLASYIPEDEALMLRDGR